MQNIKRGRKTLRETLHANNAALNHYAAMAGVAPVHNIVVPEKRAYTKREPKEGEIKPMLEKDIQKAIIMLLKRHPKVAMVGRFNSGQSVETNADGTMRYMSFNSIRGFSDIHGMMRGGKAFYIEVKRPGSGPPRDQDQINFINLIRENGGLSGFAYSVDDALEILIGDSLG